MAGLTALQQLRMLQGDEEDASVETLTFRDMKAYTAWLMAQGTHDGQ